MLKQTLSESEIQFCARILEIPEDFISYIVDSGFFIDVKNNTCQVFHSEMPKFFTPYEVTIRTANTNRTNGLSGTMHSYDGIDITNEVVALVRRFCNVNY
jgi:hypothetical protein